MQHRILRRLAVGAALLTALAGCASAESGGSDGASALPTGDALVKAAQAEGQVVVYTGWRDDSIAAVKKAFQEKYGIEVVISERLSSAALGQRIAADVRANGKINADWVLTTDQALAASLREEGQSTPVSAADFPGVKPEFILGDYAVGCTVGVPVVGYNKEVLGGKTIDSWDDLLDPALKGKIMVADPRNSAAWAGAWTSVVESQLGADFASKIAAQQIQPVTSSLVGTEQLGAGQGGVLLFGIPSLFEPAQKQGLPIDLWYPKDPSPVFYNFCLQTANAAHPNAGALFAQWYMTPEAQQLVQGIERLSSPLGDLPGLIPLPADMAALPAPDTVQKTLPDVVSRLGLT
jgi:iron(III) transport system substrate-binding protein